MGKFYLRAKWAVISYQLLAGKFRYCEERM